MPNECYNVRASGTTFFMYDILVVLSFELGDHFAILAVTCQLTLIVVVVILTITSAFRYRTPTASPNRSRYAISALVLPRTSLRRVIYRDGKPLTNTPPPKTNKHVSGVGFFLVLFGKELFDS